MRNSFFHRRIPSLLGFFLIGAGILVSSWFLQTGVLFPTQAASGGTPENVRISNVTDTSFTLSYTTKEAVTGYILYGTTPDGSTRATDARDSGAPTPSTVHNITLQNLNSNTMYYYKIVSDGKEYLKGASEPYTFTTPEALPSDEGEQFVLSGSVQLINATPALVYVSTADSQVISTLTSSSGAFSFSYPSLRSRDFSSLASFSPTSPVTLLLTNGESSSKVKSVLSSSDPLPAISLSQNYDFASNADPIGIFDASDSADLAGFPSFDAEEQDDEASPEIISPEENEGFSDQRPQFRGRALPNESVEIIIHSEQEIKTSVKANSNGSWTYRPTTELAPGEHTLTVRTRDSFGILQELKQSFVVYAEGSQFTDPSISPVRTPTTTRTPTPSSRPPSGTPSPTLTPTGTPSPTLSPTLVPSIAQITPTITPSQPLPAAGSPAMILAGIVGTISISVGLFVLMMSKGAL